MQPANIHLLSERRHIERHAAAIEAATTLGVDTEFVRERTYFPRPGLIQFSDGVDAWLVDPVGLDGDASLNGLIGGRMRDPATTKVLHSTGEDLEVLVAVGDAMPAPLFDTQRAAALLGWPLQVRYEVLAAELLDAEFPGGLGRNNWLRRPLPREWIEYAANDVIALPRMKECLAERLERHGRLGWLTEDCARIVQRAGDAASPESRIKGAAGLDDEQLERLARLARWRESQAEERDLPRGFVARDGVLLALARGGAGRFDESLSSAGDDAPRRSRDRNALRAILEAAPEPYERPADLQPLGSEERARIKKLQAEVRAVAEDIGIEPALLASRRDLTRWVQGADCDWLTGWRGDVLAEALAKAD
ncbi:MAG: ribonuclease D [Candidatus Wenzhouxiangella sp. M2_3B_020]